MCEVCAEHERRKQEARTLAGSPYETAHKAEIRLPEVWR